MMLPAGEITERTAGELAALLEPGDVIVDGGNTHYVDDIRRGGEFAAREIRYVDVGVSGGVFGLERGFCLMVGADDEAFRRLEPVLVSLAPGMDAAARTRGREGAPSPAERGYLRCGPVGAGHFVKMVHNGIEYGLMAALAEGFNVLHGADAGGAERDRDAETAPLEHPERYRYDIDVAEVAELWRRGSVVSSWLLDLAAASLHASPDLEGFAGRVSDSGEGRWTSIAAIEEGVPTPVLSAALFSRFDSRGASDFANRVLSAMRKEFGGHVEKPA
jgi:6-phosphogluconate dehydrogenase